MCYGLNVCVPPPDLYTETRTPNVMVVRGIIIRRLDEAVRVGAHDRINALIRKEETGELSLCHVRTELEGGSLQAKEDSPYQTPDLPVP